MKCIDDEIPFEIPEGWEWCRLGVLFSHCTGKALNGINKKGKQFPYITTSNLYWDRFEISTLKEMYFTDEELDKCTATKGDLLVCEGGDIGRSAIWNYDYDIRIQNHIHKLRAYLPLCTRFFYYVMFLYKGIGNIGGKGIGIQGLSSGALHNIVLPLPSIQEQERIVAQIETIMPLAVKYEKSQDELNRLNDNIYTRLRKSILQEAIQGKLVPQDPNDEPASVLLERIREEKQRLLKEGKLKRKDITDSIIFKGEDNKYFEKIGKEIICIDDDIPFDIPISWEWVRLGNLFQHNTGKALNGSNQKGTLYEYITTSNLYWNQFVLDKLRQMLFTNEELEKCTVRKGDLLICEGGDIGRCAIWNYDYDIRIQNHIHRLRAFTPVCTGFFYYTMYLYKHIGLIGGKGIGIQGLSSNALHKLLLPLPPMNEQQRIVNKIESAIASIMSR